MYKHIYGSGHHLVHVVEEIGPSTTTNLCYMKGHFIDCHIDGDVAHTGRSDTYLCCVHAILTMLGILVIL